MKSIIIIGGGILGASTAYHLAGKGVSVALVDRFDKGKATDAAAGIVCPWLSQRRNQAWYQLAKKGANYYDTLIKMLKEDGEEETGYKKVGALSLHNDVIKLDKMEQRACKKREDAPEMGTISKLSSEGTKEIFPLLADHYSSLYVSGAARVDGRRLCQSLIRAAERKGVQFIKGDAELFSHSNGRAGVRINKEQIAADVIIVTAGAWAGDLLMPLGVDIAMSSQKAQIVHLKTQDELNERYPVIMPPNDQYLVPFGKNKVVIGATHENDRGFDTRVTAGGMHEILEKALDAAPGLINAEITETRVGHRPFTPGFLPVIGEIPGFKDLFFANGLGASGLTTGPFLGLQLAKLALKEELDIEIGLYPVEGAIRK
ncbi:NAD(P)/FAD-dependent oxidoreductase [Jeotgalibacillus proteolyticus]|uniref:FAD-dependent oxidoreductase n=1 Tax=Jeotgalibacillus proteolyticus TaxID=2082395 RepID=A0A2S5GGW8_9BACL|nr:FAD-dependent oxidoreductase [Jeotgalibacillus proteolyticus]PPA72292.1 FAD-dependent oxidoreductase [Jeotgalibacillus proteolyticus]